MGLINYLLVITRSTVCEHTHGLGDGEIFIVAAPLSIAGDSLCDIVPVNLRVLGHVRLEHRSE